MFQPFSQTLFFWKAFRKATDVRMFFTKVTWIVLMQHGGFARMPTVSTEVPRRMLWWRSRWRCFVPFPKTHTSLIFFSGFLKDFNHVFFSSIAPRDTTRWHKQYAKMMGEKERLTWNLMQFVCIHFVSLWGIHSWDFPGFYWWFHFDSPSCLAGKTPWACGKNTKKVWAKLVEVVGRCGRGRTKSKSFF